MDLAPARGSMARDGGGVIDPERRAVAVEGDAVDPERELGRSSKATPAIPGGRDDPAPVRVGSGNGRLDQRAIGDRPLAIVRAVRLGRRQPSTSIVIEVGRALAVVGDQSSPAVPTHAPRTSSANSARVQRLTGEPVRARPGEQKHGVVGAHVPFDGDAVERVLDRPGEDLLEVGRQRPRRRSAGSRAWWPCSARSSPLPWRCRTSVTASPAIDPAAREYTFGPGIGGHDRPRDLVEARPDRRTGSSRARRGSPASSRVHRELVADHAG